MMREKKREKKNEQEMCFRRVSLSSLLTASEHSLKNFSLSLFHRVGKQILKVNTSGIYRGIYWVNTLACR